MNLWFFIHSYINLVFICLDFALLHQTRPMRWLPWIQWAQYINSYSYTARSDYTRTLLQTCIRFGTKFTMALVLQMLLLWLVSLTRSRLAQSLGTILSKSSWWDKLHLTWLLWLNHLSINYLTYQSESFVSRLGTSRSDRETLTWSEKFWINWT